MRTNRAISGREIPGFLDIAFDIIREKKKPLSPLEICNIAVQKKILHSSGKTPAKTMSCLLNRSIKVQGSDALFKKVKRGKFYLQKWALEKDS